MSEPYVERMRSELADLDDRINRLAKFLNGNTAGSLPGTHSDGVPFCDLHSGDQSLLLQQMRAMCTYRLVLQERIGRATNG